VTSFDQHVARALERLPAEFQRALTNMAVVVEDRHPEDPDLYGLFEDGGEFFPDKITIFRRPLMEDYADAAELEHEIRVTVLHEIGHYFGLDEQQLEELGYE
jgi:predicted Zn-dependent protease with MMP-like domain